MTPFAHELALDLEPAVTAENGLLYRVTVVARAAPDGHWNAWLEFVASDSHDVLRTAIETHQATEADVHHWATTLSDVYLRGAMDRALISSAETAAHRQAVAQASGAERHGMANAFDPFELLALGEHVLRRELQLLRRATLLALISNRDLNSGAHNLSNFTTAQLVAFIVTAVEVRQARSNHARSGQERRNHRAG